jgi:hypothetical protein
MQSKVQAAISHAMAANNMRKKLLHEQQQLVFRETAHLHNNGERITSEAIAAALGINLQHAAARRQQYKERRENAFNNIRLKWPELQEKIYYTRPHIEDSPTDDEPISLPVCLFPADRCQADTSVTDNESPQDMVTGCDASKAALYLFNTSEGVGGHFGVEAYPASAPIVGSLWYGFMPPAAGTLAIVAEIFASGLIVTDAHVEGDFDGILAWLQNTSGQTITEADTRLDFRLQVTQADRLVLNDVMTGIHFHANPGQTFYQWYDDEGFVMVSYAQIEADEPVVIQFSAELNAFGRSSGGSGYMNFTENYHKPQSGAGIRVPALCLNITPTTIL